MTLEYNCITCDQHFKLDKGEGGIVIVVWKDGSKFYACSLGCAAEARDDNELGPADLQLPFAGAGERSGKAQGNRGNLPDFDNLRQNLG